MELIWPTFTRPRVTMRAATPRKAARSRVRTRRRRKRGVRDIWALPDRGDGSSLGIGTPPHDSDSKRQPWGSESTRMSKFAWSSWTFVTVAVTPYSPSTPWSVSVHLVVATTYASRSSGHRSCGREPAWDCSWSATALASSPAAPAPAPHPAARRSTGRTTTARRITPSGCRTVEQPGYGFRHCPGDGPAADQTPGVGRGDADRAEHLERLHVRQGVEPPAAQRRPAGRRGPTPQPQPGHAAVREHVEPDASHPRGVGQHEPVPGVGLQPGAWQQRHLPLAGQANDRGGAGRVPDEPDGVELSERDDALAGQRDLDPVVALTPAAAGLPALAHGAGEAGADQLGRPTVELVAHAGDEGAVLQCRQVDRPGVEQPRVGDGGG